MPLLNLGLFCCVLSTPISRYQKESYQKILPLLPFEEVVKKLQRGLAEPNSGFLKVLHYLPVCALWNSYPLKLITKVYNLMVVLNTCTINLQKRFIAILIFCLVCFDFRIRFISFLGLFIKGDFLFIKCIYTIY